MERATDHSLKVFMLPWLAHGHISPFLELAKTLSKRNIFIYICSTPINLQSITGKLENYSATIQVVELHLPSSPEIPPHLHTTKGLPPDLLKTLGDAFQSSLPNLSDILKKLNPDIVIHEIMHPWVGQLASTHNIPAVDFVTASATHVSFSIHMLCNPGVEYPISGIYLHDFEKEKSFGLTRSGADGVKNRHCPIESPKTSCNITLITSFRELEAEAIDYCSVLTKKKVLPVGISLAYDHVDKSSNDNSKIIKWLSKKEKHSCVYVSFGSEYFMSKEEMQEIAYGLEFSEVNFIWVVRFPKEVGKEKIRVLEEELPQGFLERVGERGLVLEGWAPQVEILSHESVGGFVSHCGWNSIMESLKFGVPIIALPIHFDQPLNARLICQVGVAMEVVRGEKGRMKREELAKAIRQVVVDKSGEDVRRKAREFYAKLVVKGEEEIDVLVQELSRVCKDRKKIVVSAGNSIAK